MELLNNNANSPLKKFLEHCVVRSKKYYASANLLRMDGGLYHIPGVMQSSFWHHLSNIDPNKEAWALVERLHDINRVFFDFDLKLQPDQSPPHLDRWKDVATSVRNATKRCFPSLDESKFDAYVSMGNEPYIDKKGKLKCGVHMIMPKLALKLETQRLLQLTVVEILNDKYNKSCEVLCEGAKNLDWGEVVDVEVYSGKGKGGLRTILSYKAKECPICNNNSDYKKECTTCNKYGKVADGRPYMPQVSIKYPADDWVKDRKASRNHSIFAYNEVDVVEEEDTLSFEVPSDLVKRVKNASMKTYGSTDGVLINLMLDRNNKNLKAAAKSIKLQASKKKRKRGGRKPSGIQEWDDESQINKSLNAAATCFNGSKERIVFDDPELQKKLGRFIGDNVKVGSFVYPYKEKTEVNKKFIYLSGYKGQRVNPKFIIELTGDGAKYCIRKKDTHNSRNAWFVLNDDMFTQRCFSQNKDNDKKEPCCNLPKTFKLINLPVQEQLKYFDIYRSMKNMVEKKKKTKESLLNPKPNQEDLHPENNLESDCPPAKEKEEEEEAQDPSLLECPKGVETSALLSAEECLSFLTQSRQPKSLDSLGCTEPSPCGGRRSRATSWTISSSSYDEDDDDDDDDEEEVMRPVLGSSAPS